MAYNILAINPGHNGSAALLRDGEIVFYGEEERFSRLKHDGNPFRAMLQSLMSVPIHHLIIGGTNNNYESLPWTGEDAYTALVRKFNPEVKVTKLGDRHHFGHACNAFYNSGFKTAAAVIVDGAGSYHTEKMGSQENDQSTGGYETESIFACSYPANIAPAYKRYADGNSITYDNGLKEFDDTVTITKAYEAVTNYLGWHFIEGGKTMGLAPYGKYDSNIPPLFVNGKGNKNILRPAYPAGAIIDEYRFPYLIRSGNITEWHNDEHAIDEKYKNLAWHVQQETQNLVAKLIRKAVDITGETNIVISGGYGLNCVANYFYKKTFPDLNIYVDPISHDGGTALGLALCAWHEFSNNDKPNKLKTLYLSSPPDYSQVDGIINNSDGFLNIKSASYDDIVDLLTQEKIVAMFNGCAEAGPRALGNRSILFDPRVPDGKDKVNKVKGREWFRPFAGSVLKEHAGDWFDMAGMEESPFMMYAVNVKEDKVSQIPSVCHIDNTCRIQTVSKDDNEHYYNLISAFYNKTNCPVLFNTSFNLGGDPLVETIIDAINTIGKSEINYLYLPELGKLIYKNEMKFKGK
jgi:carbamoyltransferase